MDEEIKDAQTSDVSVEEFESDDQGKFKKRKTDYYIELALFLILGLLIGIAIKTEAVKRVTIGFDDYKMKMMKQDYDVNKIQSDLIKKSNEAAQTAPADQGTGAGTVPSDQSEIAPPTGQDNSANNNQ